MCAGEQRVWNRMLRRAKAAQEAFEAVRGVRDDIPSMGGTDHSSSAAEPSSQSTFGEEALLRLLRRRDLCVSDYELLRLLARVCKETGQPLAQWAVNVDFGKLTSEQVWRTRLLIGLACFPPFHV